MSSEKTERGNFGSRLGIVLATAGSAVGLGNVWRFPYMAGENGGAAFIIIYIVCIAMLGMPGMIAEFIVGRHAQANAARAYDKLSGGKPWRVVGYLGIVTSTIILGFYAVVAGWCLQYLFAAIGGGTGSTANEIKDYFVRFSSDPLKPLLWGIGFVAITHVVVVRGVRRGIERASKTLMPLLFVLLIALVIAACTLPGATGGLRFLLMPDFSKLSGSVLLEALGQAFFSLSLGTACLCTYASYFKRDTNITTAAAQIATLDTLIAIMSGLIIFPAAAAVGISPDSGPSLVFITLPNVFMQAFSPTVGYVVSIMFFALLVFAALTSTISMHEIGTAFFSEELNISRGRAAWIVSLIAAAICIASSLSVGAVSSLQVAGLSVMDFCDHLTANYLLPAGALLTCLFVGWYVPRTTVYNELTNGGSVSTRLFPLFMLAVRYVCPLSITLIFLHQMRLI